MLRKGLFLAVLGGGLAAGPLVAAEDAPPVILHIHGDPWKHPRQTASSVHLGWWLEGGVKKKDEIYRATYSQDGGKTWESLYAGHQPSYVWSLAGQPTTGDGVLRVELVGADGRVVCKDEITGVVIDDVVPEVVAETAPLSKDRRILVHANLKNIGPSGLALVQVWVTRDGGFRWHSAGTVKDQTTPFQFEGEKGHYGFIMTGVSGARAFELHPVPGEKPEVEVDISPEEPMVRLQVGPVPRFPRAAETVAFEWTIVDEDLPENPATAEYRTSEGKWVEIFKGGPAEGSHLWTLPSVSMSIVDLRVRARDLRGNSGEQIKRIACWVDADPPAGEILGPAVWDREGEIEVHYRVNESGSGIERAQMLYRTPGGDWHPFATLPPAGSVVRRMLQDGAYELVITARDRAGNDVPPEAANLFAILVDRALPAVRIDAVAATPEGVSLAWSSSDPNLGNAPVQLSCRVDDQTSWTVLKEGLPAVGTWAGPLPDGIREGMGVTLRAVCTDLSGKSVAAVVAIRVTGEVPMVHLKEVRFTDVLKLIVAWESAGVNLAQDPVDLKVVFWRGAEQEVLFHRTNLPAVDSLTISIPKELPANQIFVEVGCRNQWGARQCQSATVDLTRPEKGYPAFRFTGVAVQEGRLTVKWETEGVGASEKSVAVEYGEEGGEITVRKGLPAVGELALDVLLKGRQSIRIRGLCVDNKGCEGEATVFVVIPESVSGGGDRAGLRIQQIVLDGRRVTVSWATPEDAGKEAVGPVRLEWKSGEEWVVVKDKLPPSGTFTWEVPASAGGAIALRVAREGDPSASAVETVALGPSRSAVNVLPVIGQPQGTGTDRPQARAIWPSEALPDATPEGPPPGVSVPDPLRLAREMLAHGHAEEADQFLRVYLAKRPDALEAYLLQIQALRFLNRKGPELIDLYRRALSLSPYNATLLGDLGIYFMVEERDFKQALAYFEEALGAGQTPEAYHNVGRARFHLRDYVLAAAAFERALAIDPRFSEARYFLARLYTETPLRDSHKAARLWEVVRAESKDNPERASRAEDELAKLR